MEYYLNEDGEICHEVRQAVSARLNLPGILEEDEYAIISANATTSKIEVFIATKIERRGNVSILIEKTDDQNIIDAAIEKYNSLSGGKQK